MNTGGPAFPFPDTYHPNGQVQFGSNGMTLLDWYAGQALTSRGLYGANVRENEVAKECYTIASAMLSEKARREAAGNGSAQPREVDDDRWAKFQDGIRIVFQPGNGWCAEIRDGSMGYGNTIAEAIANLRARWEERSAAPVVQQSSTTADAAKVAELQAANRELVEALDNIIDGWVDRNDDAELATKARAILSKHKGTA